MEQKTAVLLAGGKAIRAGGANKANFLLGTDTLLEHFEKEFWNYEIRIAAPKIRFPEREALVLEDRYDAGPLGAIVGALEGLKQEWVFFAACDMPYIGRDMAEILYENRDGALGVCFRDETERLQPLFVLLSGMSLPMLKAQMEAGNLSLRYCFEKIGIRALSGKEYGITDERFENWNTEHEEKKDFP